MPVRRSTTSSRHFRRIDPITRSASALCQQERGTWSSGGPPPPHNQDLHTVASVAPGGISDPLILRARSPPSVVYARGRDWPQLSDHLAGDGFRRIAGTSRTA